jgi:molybdenum cofactor biosynthesis protein MoaC
MRDISQKTNSLRTAIARAVLRVSPSTVTTIRQGKVPKGDPLTVAKVAAVQASKRTSDIIPFCHPIPVEHTAVEFKLDEDAIEIRVSVKAIYKTGVEMEALTAASVAALTIYDMTKMLDENMVIESIRLENKTGGKSDFAKKKHDVLRAAVIVLSDSVSQGKSEDVSGSLIAERLKQENIEVVEFIVLPDDESDIVPAVRRCSDDLQLDLIVTTGGTGIGPRDTTPEAIARLLERELPGVSESIRAYGQDRNPFSMLSRATAGIRNKTLIISLPGSPGGVRDSLEVIFPAVSHAFHMLVGEGHPTQKEKAKK